MSDNQCKKFVENFYLQRFDCMYCLTVKVKKKSKKKYVIVVPEELHFSLRQAALIRRSKLAELVQKLLWEGLKSQ